MWKPGSSVGHGADKFCTPLSSPGTKRQYLLQVSICREACYIPCKNCWVHSHSGPKRWSLPRGFRRVEPSLPAIKQRDWSYTTRKSGECKARLFWFGLSTVHLTSLQQKAPLTTETLKSHVRKSLPAPLVSTMDLSIVHKLASKIRPHSQHRGRCKDIFKVGNNFTHYPNVQKQNA